MTQTHRLPPKLEAVIVRLGKSLRLSVTNAVKLPYLVDVVATRVLGRRITEARYEAWDKGVVANEAWHGLSKADESEKIHLARSLVGGPKWLVVEESLNDDALDEDEKRIVDAVLAEFGGISASELGRITKRMNPEISGWGSNHRARVSSDAFDRLSDNYQEMASAVRRLRPRDFDSYDVVDDIEEAIA